MNTPEKEFREAYARRDREKMHDLAGDVGFFGGLRLIISCGWEECWEIYLRDYPAAREIWNASRPEDKEREIRNATRPATFGLSSNPERSDGIFRRNATQVPAASDNHTAELGSNSEVNVLEEVDHEMEESISELTPLFSRDSCFEVPTETVGLRRRPQQCSDNNSAAF